MHICCLNDTGGWGQALAAEAVQRGHKGVLFGAPTGLPQMEYAPQDTFVFMRLAQEAEQLVREKKLMQRVAKAGLKLIPDLRSGLMYEDKIAQTRAFSLWMPETRIYTDAEAAARDIEHFAYPFLSKSATGSASRNVRIVRNADQALDEIEMAFGAGLEAPHKLGERVQRGYLLWQELLMDNHYDYRVIVVGRQMMVLQRHNKPGTIFASGSGINNPVNELTDEVEAVLSFARDFVDHENIFWCGLDIVFEHTLGEPLLLETTLGWSARAYDECKFFGTQYTGRSIWKVLMNEIEAGVFA